MSATLRGLGLCIDDLGSTFGTSSAPPVVPGTIVEDDTGHRFMFVYNTGSTSITQYYPAFHTDTSTSGYVGSAGIGAPCVAGIAMTAIDSSNYGWICIRGYVTAYCGAAVGTIGWGLKGGSASLATVTQAGDVTCAQAIVTSNAAALKMVKMLIG